MYVCVYIYIYIYMTHFVFMIIAATYYFVVICYRLMDTLCEYICHTFFFYSRYWSNTHVDTLIGIGDTLIEYVVERKNFLMPSAP